MRIATTVVEHYRGYLNKTSQYLCVNTQSASSGCCEAGEKVSVKPRCSTDSGDWVFVKHFRLQLRSRLQVFVLCLLAALGSNDAPVHCQGPHLA